MHLEIVDSVADAGQGVCNEDVAGSGSRSAWIIDGATGVESREILPACTDARWLSDFIDSLLTKGLIDQGGTLETAPIETVFASIAQSVHLALTEHNYPSEMLPPACSMGVVRLFDSHVELALVGDATLFYAPSTSSDAIELSNPYFGKREAAAVRARHAGISSDSTLSADDRSSIAGRRRRYIDGSDGQFIMSSNPGVQNGVAVRTAAPVEAGATLLLCTDGFARATVSYRLYRDTMQMLEAALRSGLPAILRALRDFESTMGGSTENYKASDDACAILLRVCD